MLKTLIINLKLNSMSIFVIILTIIVYINFFIIISFIKKGKITRRDIKELKEADDLGILRLLLIGLLIPYVNIISITLILCFILIALILFGIEIAKEKINNWVFKNETDN